MQSYKEELSYERTALNTGRGTFQFPSLLLVLTANSFRVAIFRSNNVPGIAFLKKQLRNLARMTPLVTEAVEMLVIQDGTATCI